MCIRDSHRDEIVKSCIYKISEAIHDVDDLQSLYKEIHYIISEVTNTNNFYIALVDWNTEILTFPYFVDEKDSQPKPSKLKKGLTEYVLRTEQSILLNEDLYKQLVENKSIDVLVENKMHGQNKLFGRNMYSNSVIFAANDEK